MSIIKLAIFWIVEMLLFLMAMRDGKSKWVYNLILIHGWILFAFCVDSFDISNYRYTYELNIFRGKEIVYDKLQYFFANNGIRFETFKFIWGSIQAIILYFGLKKYSNYQALCAALFMIVPMGNFITQMRNSMAGAIIIYSIPFLFYDKKWNTIKYCVGIIIATLFHYMAIFYFILIIPKIIKIKSDRIRICFFWGILFLAICFWLSNASIQRFLQFLLNNTNNTFVKQLFGRIVALWKENLRPNIKGFLLYVIHHLLLFLLLEASIKRLLLCRDRRRGRFSDKELSFIRDINLMMLLIVPAYAISGHFTRLLYYFLPVCYGVTIQVINEFHLEFGHKRRYSFWAFDISILLIIACTFFVYIMGIQDDINETIRIIEGIRI